MVLPAGAANLKHETQAQCLVHGSRPEDLTAARDYLSLVLAHDELSGLIAALRNAPTIEHDAKDLLRASQTHLLEKDQSAYRRKFETDQKGKEAVPGTLDPGGCAQRRDAHDCGRPSSNLRQLVLE